MSFSYHFPQVGGHSLVAGDGERVSVSSILPHPDFDPLNNQLQNVTELSGIYSCKFGNRDKICYHNLLYVKNWHFATHPPTNEADLALVSLQEPVEIGKRIGLACLPREGAALQMRDALMVKIFHSSQKIFENKWKINSKSRWGGVSTQAAPGCRIFPRWFQPTGAGRLKCHSLIPIVKKGGKRPCLLLFCWILNPRPLPAFLWWLWW